MTTGCSMTVVKQDTDLSLTIRLSDSPTSRVTLAHVSSFFYLGQDEHSSSVGDHTTQGKHGTVLPQKLQFFQLHMHCLRCLFASLAASNSCVASETPIMLSDIKLCAVMPFEALQ